MRRPEFPVYLRTALERLRVDVPEAYAAISQALAVDSIAIAVARAPCTVGSLDGELKVTLGAAARTRVETDWTTLFALLDGRLDLLAALRSDDLRLFGSVGAIVRFESALRAFVAGAIRSPSMPSLQEDLRQRLQLGGENR